ncbi:MAG: protein-ADP-ribose hydrolase [Eubacteriales bacterium]
MDHLKYLIDYLCKESGVQNPQQEYTFDAFRELVNVRQPILPNEEFIKIQNEYLQILVTEKGTIDFDDMQKLNDFVYIWQGDITRMKVDAIVNAANSGMLGCFHPGHLCIDNTIHTYAGIQLRLECNEIMKKQGTPEPMGQAKITKAYNLPCNYIVHTVGPTVGLELGEVEEQQLRKCYQSILELAHEKKLESIAICCIATGEFHFPHERACEIAIETVKAVHQKYRERTKVVFNVYKDVDYYLYCDHLQKIYR